MSRRALPGRPDAPRGADGRLVPVLGATARLNLRVTPEQRKRWLREAKAAGLTLNEWIRRACDAAAR